MRTSQLILITLFISIAIFAAILFWLGLDKMLEVLVRADYFCLLLATVFQFASVFALYLRWQYIVNYSGILIKKTKLCLALFAGVAVAHLTPTSRFGGEPIRVIFLRKFGKTRTGEALATVLVDRVLDAIMFSVFSLLALILAVAYWHLPFWIVLLLFISFLTCTAIILLLIYISLNKKAGLRTVFWILKKFNWLIKRFKSPEELKEKIVRNVSVYSESAVLLLKIKNIWAYGLFFSAMVWVFELFRTYFVFLALGFDLSLLIIMAMLTISTLAGSLPFLPGGLLITEATMIVIYTASGIPIVIAGMATILDRLISFWIVNFVGLAASYHLGAKYGNA